MTTLRELLLDILRDNGGWMSRKDIGAALGRPRSYPVAYDIDLLEGLVAAGLVERDDRLSGAVKVVKYYRIKGE